MIVAVCLALSCFVLKTGGRVLLQPALYHVSSVFQQSRIISFCLRFKQEVFPRPAEEHNIQGGGGEAGNGRVPHQNVIVSVVTPTHESVTSFSEILPSVRSGNVVIFMLLGWLGSVDSVSMTFLFAEGKILERVTHLGGTQNFFNCQELNGKHSWYQLREEKCFPF